MFKINLQEGQNVDYIYCLSYLSIHYFRPLKISNTTVECSLDQRQRSSQQILDLADYLARHYEGRDQSVFPEISRYESSSSFIADTPIWIELTNANSFFDYFKDKFESNDVMLIWNYYHKPSNLNDIEKFCSQQNWRFVERINVTGSEAVVTILYDLDNFFYEHFTRAKSQLVIVTIHGKPRYSFNLKIIMLSKLILSSELAYKF